MPVAAVCPRAHLVMRDAYGRKRQRGMIRRKKVVGSAAGDFPFPGATT